MRGYVPGEQPTEVGWVKLNTNENAFPPSPRVLEAIAGFARDTGTVLRRYPEPLSRELRAAIAARHGVHPDQVLVGNGCDDVLNLLLRTFAGPAKPAAMMVPSYSLYGVLADIAAAPMRRIAFGADMQLDARAITASGANLFLLTNPNAPTGVAFAPEALEGIVAAFDGIFVIDETYAPFADVDCVSLLAEHRRVVITRSFSKAYSLAGLRVGYALADAAVIGLLDRVRDSYNLDAVAQAAAKAALEDDAYAQAVWARTREMREAMTAFYRDELGWHCYRSAANFHLVEPQTADRRTGPDVAGALYDFLKERRILVRYLPGSPLTEARLRISLGSEDEMATLKAALKAWAAS